MTKKPVILISAAHDVDPKTYSEIFLLNEKYAWAVVSGGGIPLLAVDPENIDEYVKLADGLVLTGGWGLNMDYINQTTLTPKYMGDYINAVRLPVEAALYKAFRDAKKPILGICAGHQAINAGQGGVLNYDIPGTFHVEHRDGIEHEVRTEEGSFVRELFGERFTVNSFHQYCIQELGRDLKITAWSDEGIPEACEHTSLPIYGFQWHPERMRGDAPIPQNAPDMTLLFKAFSDKCLACRAN